MFPNPKGYPKGCQIVAGGRSDSGDLRRRSESTGTPKAVPEQRFMVPKGLDALGSRGIVFTRRPTPV